MLRSPQRRARPMEMGPSSNHADAVLGEPHGEHALVQPVADERVVDLSGDPADVASARESIRLAFVAALQHRHRQRSVLILCEVLRWQATEVAEPARHHRGLGQQRSPAARATVAAQQGEPLDDVVDPLYQALLARRASTPSSATTSPARSSPAGCVILSMPPFDLWLRGPENLAGWFLGEGIVCGRAPAAGLGQRHRRFRQLSPGGPGLWEPWPSR